MILPIVPPPFHIKTFSNSVAFFLQQALLILLAVPEKDKKSPGTLAEVLFKRFPACFYCGALYGTAPHFEGR